MFSVDSIKGFKRYLSLALPSYFMLSMPQWALEICSFMAGLISVEAMSAQATLFNLGVFLLQFPMGFMYSCSTFVGNNIGKQQIKLAQYYAKVTFCMAIVMELVIVTFLNMFHTEVTAIYTDDEDTMPIIDEAIKFLSMNVFMQGLAATLSGTMRGIGKQKIGLMNAFIGIYLFGIPISYMAAFQFNLEVDGLWLGCSLGVLIVISLHIMYLVTMADWQISDKALRMRAMRMGLAPPKEAAAETSAEADGSK